MQINTSHWKYNYRGNGIVTSEHARQILKAQEKLKK